MDENNNNLVYTNQELPCITKETRKSVNGTIIEQEFVSVREHTLQECKKILKDIK